MGSLEDIEENGRVNEPLLVNTPSKGGLKTLPFILGIDGMEKAVSFGMQPNMIMYLMGSYGLEMASGSNILFWWGAATNFCPIFGAFLADAYFGRFPMIGIGSFFSLMGMTLLWLTTMIPRASPSCNSKACSSPNPFRVIFLCSSFALMSLGTGGIRSSTAAFGADQVVKNEEDNDNKEGVVVESFFNWFCVSTYFSTMFALTILVYVQEHAGWKLGFGLPLLLFFVSIICFFSASSLFVKPEPKSSLLTGFARVLVASWRNRKFEFTSKKNVEILYHGAQGSSLKCPSEKLRFLNKACIIKDPTQDLIQEEGILKDPWHLCTIDQVEELKSIFSMIPIWSTSILFSVIPSQTLLVIQANAMDRHFLSQSFKIPAGSFGIFAFLIAFIWLLFYDRVILPLASKDKGKHGICSLKTRMEVGFLLSIMSTVTAAIIESVRRYKATKVANSALMSAMWLVPQVCFIGLAEAIGGVAQIELFYSAVPRSMSSIAANLYGLALGIASIVASLIMSLVDHITKRGGQQSWVSSDVNQGHYDYYYMVLTGLSLFNYLYFSLCSRLYWPLSGHERG